MDQRKGKKIATDAKRSVTAKKPEYRLSDAFQLFYNVRRTEGARPRTLEDYAVHWRYFTDWLAVRYGDDYALLEIAKITPIIVREYIYYMSAERTKYDNVDNRRTEGAGLSPTTISIRLRTLTMVLHYADMWGTDVAEKHAKFSPLERLKKDRLETDVKLNEPQLEVFVYGHFVYVV